MSRIDLIRVKVLARRAARLVGIPQHADEHRSKHPVLLAVDQELGEGPRRGVPPVRADRIGPLEVGERQDVEQLGAGSRAECIEAIPKSPLQLVGTHC